MSFVFRLYDISRSSFGISVDGSSKNASEMGSHTTTSFLNSTGIRRSIYTSRRLLSPPRRRFVTSNTRFCSCVLSAP